MNTHLGLFESILTDLVNDHVRYEEEGIKKRFDKYWKFKDFLDILK